ncbi:unnamed protein product [Periconia digitata]|uniref:Rhodopsin domain-containing protein n=1 Tax=Periconia digitata TaxID=1303443 RepID=A0A9W4XTG2_9PLEO|nr:unnamed protein product [Periconia digitata]
MALLFSVMDLMYKTDISAFGGIPISAISSMNLAELSKDSLHYRKVSAAAMTLMWFSICSVKFCFLAFFRRLIRQQPVMVKFWWFAVVFNSIVTGYGAVIYTAACPYFKPEELLQAIQCVQGDGLVTIIRYSMSHMVIDIIGDFFILVIPIVLIWKIRISWKQKIALSFTLCLTVVMIAITITRITGLQWKGKLDLVWEIFFIAIAAEIGLSLVAITAFRALYVSKSKSRHVPGAISTFNWYHKGKSFMLGVFSNIGGNSARGKSESHEMHGKTDDDLGDPIPNATMTGMRTFIDQNGKSEVYETMDEEGRIWVLP